MQRTGTNRRVALYITFAVLFCLLVFLDQFTKIYLKNLKETESFISTTVINGFFYITYVTNTGAAWSFLSGVSWAQTFFKILTGVALVFFVWLFVYSVRKRYTFLSITIIIITAGALGNFIDRIAYNYVIDFLSFRFGNYNFPVFNLADSFMTVGVIMLIINYLFIDPNALFKSNKKKDEN